VAARLRREFGTDIEMVHGRYGEYKILVDGDVVIDAGAPSALGIVPSDRKVVEAVRRRWGSAGHQP
jgi:hypothetical protein